MSEEAKVTKAAEHYSDGRKYSHISNAWILEEGWNDAEEVASLCQQLEAAQTEIETYKADDLRQLNRDITDSLIAAHMNSNELFEELEAEKIKAANLRSFNQNLMDWLAAAAINSADLTEQLAQSEADVRRMDWLERQYLLAAYQTDVGECFHLQPQQDRKTVRHSIDEIINAAIAAEGAGGKE